MIRRFTNSTSNDRPSSGDVHLSQEPLIRSVSRPIEIAGTIDYRLEVNRLTSFKFWPYKDWIKPEKLAEAGFYYVGGNHHAVKCFACQYIFPAFCLSERPMLDHHRYSINCDFIQHYFGNVPIDTEIHVNSYFIPPENISAYSRL